MCDHALEQCGLSRIVTCGRRTTAAFSWIACRFLTGQRFFCLIGTGRLDEAEAYLTKLAGQYEKVMGGQHIDTLMCLSNLATVKRDQGASVGPSPLHTMAPSRSSASKLAS